MLKIRGIGSGDVGCWRVVVVAVVVLVLLMLDTSGEDGVSGK